jgi:orotidine-5'-phosphate decarboxylase
MERDALLNALRAVPWHQRVITALDVPDAEAALTLADRLGGDARFVKVGLELFGAVGPTVVRALRQDGRQVFLDLKFHDIPNTVAGAARAAARLDVAFLTIHASAGRRAIAAARDALLEVPASDRDHRPALLGVTVLTSLDGDDLRELAPGAGSPAAQVVRLGRLAWESGCDGLVCSAADLDRLRAELGPEPLVVTPGVRPAGAARDDQRRVTTPADARAAGTDFLVVGRPVTGADDPAAALSAIARELANA